MAGSGNDVPSNLYIDLKVNNSNVDEFVNSKDEFLINRDSANGNTQTETLHGLVLRTNQAILDNGGVPLGDGVWGAGKTYTSYNQYLVYNGVPYKPTKSTALPYLTQGADPTSLPDSDFVQPFADINEQGVIDLIGQYSDYTFSNVQDMILGVVGVDTVTHSEGKLIRSGKTVWKTVSGIPGPGKLALTGGLFAIALNGAWADDWSSDGSTFTDVEIQSAINYSDGTRGVRLGENTFIINNQVNMVTSTNSSDIYQSGNSLAGGGKDKTIIINRCGDFWVSHKPSVAQAAIGVRFQGFKLNGMSVNTDGSSLAGSSGALIYSAWQGECCDYQETGLLGDGFTLPLDAALNSNPDRYSCGIFRMDRVRFQSGEGIGLNCENPSLTLTIDNYYIVGNKSGGFFLAGASHNVLSGSIAGNGETAAVNGFGLHLAHSTGFTQHNVRVFGAEIDNNYGRDIIVDGFSNDIECRIIQDGSTGFKATDMIYFNSAASGAAKNNTAKIRIRIDNANANAINVVTSTDTAGTEDNKVDIVYGVTGDDTNVIKANLMGTTRERNTVSQDGHVIGASHKGAINNTNKSFISPASSMQLGTTASILPFTSVYDDFGLWSANKFTAPHTGLVTVAFSAPFRDIILNSDIVISIKVNGATVSDIEFSGGTGVTSGQRQLSFIDTNAVNSGDEVEIFGRSGVINGTFFISDTDATTKISME